MNIQAKLQELYDAYFNENDTSSYFDFMDAVYETFPEWTHNQAYIATDFLFRPENMN